MEASTTAESQRSVGPRRPLLVFALGCGAGMRFRGALARQITDDLAQALSRFPTLAARPMHLIEGEAPAILDPNLSEDAEVTQVEEGASGPRLRFVLYASLPADAVVRELTRASGHRLALSGRLVIDGDAVDLALNLWDVGPPNLLWCRVFYGRLGELASLVAAAAGELAFALEDPAAPTRAEAVSRAEASLGVPSTEAWSALASVTERLRRAALYPEEPLRHGEIARGLVATIRQAPTWETPRLLLLEHGLERLAARDQGYAAALLESVARAGVSGLLLDLLQLEALLVLGDRDDAARHLRLVEERWPGDPRVAQARARLEAP